MCYNDENSISAPHFPCSISFGFYQQNVHIKASINNENAEVIALVVLCRKVENNTFWK